MGDANLDEKEARRSEAGKMSMDKRDVEVRDVV